VKFTQLLNVYILLFNSSANFTHKSARFAEIWTKVTGNYCFVFTL